MKIWRYVVIAGISLWVISMFLPTFGKGSDGLGYVALYRGTRIALQGQGGGVDRWMFILAFIGNVSMVPGTILALLRPKTCRFITPLMLLGDIGAVGIGCMFVGGGDPVKIGYFAWNGALLVFTAGCILAYFSAPKLRPSQGFMVEPAPPAGPPRV